MPDPRGSSKKNLWECLIDCFMPITVITVLVIILIFI